MSGARPMGRPARRNLALLCAAALALPLAACDLGEHRAPRGAAHEAPEREAAPGEAAGDEPRRDEPGPPPGTTPLPVDGARAMATLSETESASVCAWLVANVPPRHVECPDGSSLDVGVGPDDGCPPAAAFAGCTLTVAETTRCMADNGRDPCAHGMFGAPTCTPFRDCMLVQMGAIRVEPAAEE